MSCSADVPGGPSEQAEVGEEEKSPCCDCGRVAVSLCCRSEARKEEVGVQGVSVGGGEGAERSGGLGCNAAMLLQRVPFVIPAELEEGGNGLPGDLLVGCQMGRGLRVPLVPRSAHFSADEAGESGRVSESYSTKRPSSSTAVK